MSKTRGVNVTKISSQEYEDRLNDIATATYYDRLLPEYERNLVRETRSGSHAIGTDIELDGWKMLAAAMTAQALLDWFDLYLGIKSPMRKMNVDLEKRKMRSIEKELMQSSFGETALLQMIMTVRRIENDPWQIDHFRRRLVRSAHSVGRIERG